MRAILRRAQSVVALLAILVLAVIVSPVASEGSRIFRCGVGVPEYTPPELHGKNFGTLDRSAKLATLRELTERHGLAARDTMAVGDGANDLDMLLASGLGIAFHAKPIVAAVESGGAARPQNPPPREQSLAPIVGRGKRARCAVRTRRRPSVRRAGVGRPVHRVAFAPRPDGASVRSVRPGGCIPR